MDISRRDFLKVSGAASVGLVLGTFGFDLRPISAYAQANPPVWVKEAHTICGYCSLGCGQIAGAQMVGGQYLITYLQGDPDHPINQGALCSKGAAAAQFSTVVDEKGNFKINSLRLTKPLYRAAGAYEWEEKSWDWVISAIANRIATTRAAGFVTTEPASDTGETITVNRCENIAFVGGAGLNNEECYLLVKLMRALGLVYIEHQARI